MFQQRKEDIEINTQALGSQHSHFTERITKLQSALEKKWSKKLEERVEETVLTVREKVVKEDFKAIIKRF